MGQLMAFDRHFNLVLREAVEWFVAVSSSEEDVVDDEGFPVVRPTRSWRDTCSL